MDQENKLLAPQRTWKLGSSGVREVMEKNCAFYDKARSILTARCAVPDCGYMLSSLGENFALPVIGDVCELCFYMYQALSNNRGLRDGSYFRNLHEKWRIQNSPEAIKAKRKKLGLDGDD